MWILPRDSGRSWQGLQVIPGSFSSTRAWVRPRISRSMEAAIMWNCTSGSASSGRLLQNATTWATGKARRPFRATAHFRISVPSRTPRDSSFTEEHSGFSRHWQPIM